MERISIFDIFKIGVGPSSSHTLGPWKAAAIFAELITGKEPENIKIHLYGSLSKTGKGHGTDLAVMLGLQAYDPEHIDTDIISAIISDVRLQKTIKIGDQIVNFDPLLDFIFENYALPSHPNGMRFTAYFKDGSQLNETFYSIGGGFLQREDDGLEDVRKILLPYPIDSAKELFDYTEQTGKSISEIVFQNELVFEEKRDIKNMILKIFHVMLEAVFKGCHKTGVLPGGLNVKRRAKAISENLLGGVAYSEKEAWMEAIRSLDHDFTSINRWVSCFALAVNEENAAFGRVVTSPTNGAAGVIPAVLLYYYFFCPNAGDEDIIKFFLTAGEIGSLFKKGATISAAVGGCQAEIGVSSAMAAGGLTEIMGGSPKQVMMAAEIAMEHHLGLTCDPIGGLVQIPCIERNAMGAIKAITATNLALSGDPYGAIVDLDTIIKTMWDTAQDMNGKYKETSEGGLAFHIPVLMPNC